MKSEIFLHLFQRHSIEEFADFATFNFFNRNYSLFNSALILLQKPGATIVQSEHAWNKKGRFINPEATPIIILQLGGPVMPVYDYSDTYGQETIDKITPEKLKAEYLATKKLVLEKSDYDSFVYCLETYGIICNEKAFGDRLYGQTAGLECPITIYRNTMKNGKAETEEIPAYYKITLNSNLPYHQRILTLFHEMGHLYCGHVRGGKATKLNRIPKYTGDRDDDILEFEAEMVSKILCDKYGIFYDGDDYLKQHMENGKEPDYLFDLVLTATDKVRKILRL